MSMEADAAVAGVGVGDLEWAVPYLPVDPKDLGRSYEAVIRVNSQSGKGGVAYLLKTDHSLDLPRRLQIEFSAVVQGLTDSEGGEVSSDEIWRIFQDEFLPTADASFERWGRYELTRTQSTSAGDGTTELTVDYRDGEVVGEMTASGNGPVDAFLNALNSGGHQVTLYDYVEHSMGGGSDAVAAAYVDLEVDGHRLWGVGIDPDTTRATLKAIVSAVNRAVRANEGVPAEASSAV